MLRLPVLSMNSAASMRSRIRYSRMVMPVRLLNSRHRCHGLISAACAISAV